MPISRPTIIDDPGTGLIGTVFDAAFFEDMYQRIESAYEGKINFLLTQIGANNSDTLAFIYGDSSTIFVTPGLAIANDGTQYTVANNTALSLDTDIDTGARAANTIYFVWIGTDSITNLTKLKISLNYDTAPTNLLHAYRLKNFFNTNAANSNIEQFSAALPETWPIGETVLWTSPYKPCGSFWAQGQALSRTHGASARIFSKLGVTWGVGDGSTTFNLPDTRGRSPMGSGQGSGLTNRTLGSKLGEESHALTLAENGSHTHTGGLHAHTGGLHTHPIATSTSTDNGGRVHCGAAGTTGNPAYAQPGGAVATSTDGAVETSSSGSGTAHNTVHPVFVGGYIIKG